jgi:ABC-type nitrate/sulfonate/bicarbonate transport system ATPase subunit
MDGVTLRYKTKDHPSPRRIASTSVFNRTLRAARPSGCGKSTLLKVVGGT